MENWLINSSSDKHVFDIEYHKVLTKTRLETIAYLKQTLFHLQNLCVCLYTHICVFLFYPCWMPSSQSAFSGHRETSQHETISFFCCLNIRYIGTV